MADRWVIEKIQNGYLTRTEYYTPGMALKPVYHKDIEASFNFLRGIYDNKTQKVFTEEEKNNV